LPRACCRHVADRLDDVVGDHRHVMLAGRPLRSAGPMVTRGASWRAWAAIVFLAIFVRRSRSCCSTTACAGSAPARTSVFINLVPVFAVTLGRAAAGEPLEASMLVGGVLVVGGILLLNRPEPARGPASHAA
jgi:drug/metabolite transporter (DMT)-like permease